MPSAKLQVLATLNGVAVWKIITSFNPAFLRHLSDAEAKTLTEALPRLIESILKEPAEAVPKKKK